MPSLSRAFLDRLALPADLVQTIRQIGEHKGRQELYRLQAPEKLENLRRVALIQSVESSNRIEGVVAAKGRVEALVNEKTTPQNRPEGEIAGYRDVLATIHAHAADIGLSDNIVLQLHRDLMKYATGAGGSRKTVSNEIVEAQPNGSRHIRFTPTAPHLTPAAMQTLHRDFLEEMKLGRIEPLILIALYVLDFLCIHPFLDGNGRMARLLSVLLLHQQGYEVGRYISLERLIEKTKESYYETLLRASQRWHDDRHDPLPWVSYWLGVVLAAYREFESRVGGLATGHGAKTDIVLSAIDRTMGSFSVSELQAMCPSVSRDWIKIVLGQLKKEGRLTLSGRGRSARWRKAGIGD
jgi:Fic family protein